MNPPSEREQSSSKIPLCEMERHKFCIRNKRNCFAFTDSSEPNQIKPNSCFDINKYALAVFQENIPRAATIPLGRRLRLARRAWPSAPSAWQEASSFPDKFQGLRTCTPSYFLFVTSMSSFITCLYPDYAKSYSNHALQGGANCARMPRRFRLLHLYYRASWHLSRL